MCCSLSALHKTVDTFESGGRRLIDIDFAIELETVCSCVRKFLCASVSACVSVCVCVCAYECVSVSEFGLEQR